jgi:hypothetical protein
VLIMSKFSLGLCYLNYQNGVFGRVIKYFLGGCRGEMWCGTRGVDCEFNELDGDYERSTELLSEMCTCGGDFSELGNLATSGEAQRAILERGENSG